MEKISLDVLNTILKDIQNIGNKGEIVERKTTEENDYNGAYYVVKLNEDTYGKDVYVKVDEYEDSYGDNYKITGVQFVKPTKVVVTDFQSF